jgi:hypothetical protein
MNSSGPCEKFQQRAITGNDLLKNEPPSFNLTELRSIKGHLMYKLSINTGGNVWALLFKEKESAEMAEQSALNFLRTQQFVQAAADNRMITLEDDYGQRANIVAGSLQGFILEDLDLTQEAMIKLHLHNQHTQIKAQQRVQNDATIKAASLGNGGVMFDPMVGRRFSS